MKVMHVVGARPNFMKVAPLIDEMKLRGGFFQQVLVHTGQHYDYNMSQIFFQHLGLPDPDEYLGVGSCSHVMQTVKVMAGFETVVEKHQPDVIVVVGDVNSTLACALVAVKMGVELFHVEAGLRSRDRSMPEEINRILTDQIADTLFTPSADADANLIREGIDKNRIHLVGNVMIDSLQKMMPKIKNNSLLDSLKLEYGGYIVVTLHRPGNVDDPRILNSIWGALKKISKRYPVVFPIHPRTRKRIDSCGLGESMEGIILIDPLGYVDFMSLVIDSRLVLTDSGGLQEETSYLGIPCFTMRDNTERPITLILGTNRLVGVDPSIIYTAVMDLDDSEMRRNVSIPLWDSHAAKRIVDIMAVA